MVKKGPSTQKRKGQTQSKASETCATLYVTNEKSNHSIENSSTVSSTYSNIQEEELSQEAVPGSLNATFQRPPYPDPIPATVVTAITSYCPPNTSTCFSCGKSPRVRRFLFYNKIEASNRLGLKLHYHIYPRTEKCVLSPVRNLCQTGFPEFFGLLRSIVHTSLQFVIARVNLHINGLAIAY